MDGVFDAVVGGKPLAQNRLLVSQEYDIDGRYELTPPGRGLGPALELLRMRAEQ